MARISWAERLEIDTHSCVVGVLLLLVIPFRWILAAFLGAAVHEFFHIGMIKLLGGEIYKIKIGVFGAEIYTDMLTPVKQILSALAGPLGSLLLIFLFPVLPLTAICGMIHGIYNLLPIYPMDGGRVLKGILDLFFTSRKSNQIYGVIEIIIMFMGIAVGVVCYIHYRLGIWFVIFIGILLIKVISRKIPCKPTQLRVQ